MTNKINIWFLVSHRDGSIEDETYGLAAEGRRIFKDIGNAGYLTAVAIGTNLDEDFETLGSYGVDRVIYITHDSLTRYHGELFSKCLFDVLEKHRPSMMLMAQGDITEDLAPRLSVMSGGQLVTHAVDFRVKNSEGAVAIRPVANGHLFEEIKVRMDPFPIISFIPSVLNSPEPETGRKIELLMERPEIDISSLKTQIIEVLEASPEELDLEDSDIIVAGGRGAGKGEKFELIHELAQVLEGTVGGTRPVVEWENLPYERQIGQTGKTVSPSLLLNCGISGANEYTAGIEKAKHVIAVNKDPRARIFRFADLGIIGDLHEILPLLIERLKEKHVQGIGKV